MSRPRCPECGRLTATGKTNGVLPSLKPIESHIVTLLKYAREFDAMTRSDERITAVDVIDYLALNVGDGAGYVKPAGQPNQLGSKRTKRKAA